MNFIFQCNDFVEVQMYPPYQRWNKYLVYKFTPPLVCVSKFNLFQLVHINLTNFINSKCTSELKLAHSVQKCVLRDTLLGMPRLATRASTHVKWTPNRQSSIFRTAFDDYWSLDSDEIKEIFSKRHILITRCPTASNWRWSSECMSRLAPLHAKIQLQGKYYLQSNYS